jgi:hypothetical protein
MGAQSPKSAVFSSCNSDQLFFARCLDTLVFRRGLRPVSLQPTAVWDGGAGQWTNWSNAWSPTLASPVPQPNNQPEKLPGSEVYLQSADAAGDGGMFMSGIMGAGTRMMSAGLSMDQVQAVTRETIAYVREKAGEDTIGEIVGAIPGLGQFT